MALQLPNRVRGQRGQKTRRLESTYRPFSMGKPQWLIGQMSMHARSHSKSGYTCVRFDHVLCRRKKTVTWRLPSGLIQGRHAVWKFRMCSANTDRSVVSGSQCGQHWIPFAFYTPLLKVLSYLMFFSNSKQLASTNQFAFQRLRWK